MSMTLHSLMNCSSTQRHVTFACHKEFDWGCLNERMQTVCIPTPKPSSCSVIETEKWLVKSWLVARWIRNKLIGCLWLRMKSDWSIKMSQVSKEIGILVVAKKDFMQFRDISRLPLAGTEVSFLKASFWKRRPRNILRYKCSSMFNFEVPPF